jgi:hypothetical protein
MEASFCSTEITEFAKAMLKAQAALQPACQDREAMLEQAGFKWNTQRQVRWKYTDAA